MPHISNMSCFLVYTLYLFAWLSAFVWLGGVGGSVESKSGFFLPGVIA